MRSLLALCALCLLVPACSLVDGSGRSDGAGSEWIELFDGETLDGWRGYRKDAAPEAWKVEDGVLTLDGSGGDLITEATYDDFVLELEWKISPGGNSGIFYRATEETGAIYENSAEMQILDNEGYGIEPTSLNGAGANYALHAPPDDYSKPAGEWNHVRITCDGARVVHEFNGHLICDFELWSPEWEALVAASKFSSWPPYGRASEGHIGLQDHGNRVWFRNIRLKPLDGSGE